MRSFLGLLLAAVVFMPSAAAQTPAKTLQIYYVDTEGGQATLFVAPSGESLLVDVGNPGGRDTDRLMLALEDAGVKQIDHLVLTHYHGDHVGGLAEFAKRVPIKRFYDHGPAAEGDRAGGQGFMEQYAQIHAGATRTVVKPGDKVPFAGLDVTVVSSAGQVLKTNLPGAGRPNPACAGFAEKDLSKVFDPDNAYSVGFVLGFGRFRTIDLGDLTWNHEGQLMCPANRLGTVDLYLTTHHGINQSNASGDCARPAAACGHHEQRHAQGWVARDVPDPRHFAGARRSVAAALVPQRHDRAQRAWRIHREYRRQRDLGQYSDGSSAGTARSRRRAWRNARGGRGTRWWRARKCASATHSGVLDQGDRIAGRHVHGDERPQRVQ